MEKMVAQFEDVLRLEIFNMMLDKMRRRKACRPSGQSTSAASTGSHRGNSIPAMYSGLNYNLSDINYTSAVDD
jgi:hypothetical protein